MSPRPLPCLPAAPLGLASLLALLAFLGVVGVLGGGARFASAEGVKAKAPDPKAAGEVYEWKSAGGVTCWWRAPKAYDAEKGTNLTLILHGSNLAHQWGFQNHPAKTFRPDDFVVSPDGTTPNGKGGFNFLDADGKKFRALLEELRAVMKVRGVYLYGHSQGSFFALQYAGDFPEDVNGVVAHASGLWMSTATGKKGHHQAIVLMHGTRDPVVPYGQSVGGYDALLEAGYPMLRLRSLEGWNHWPAEVNGPVPHTSQQLAWVEGMTTTDPERLAACFDVLAKVENDGLAEHDFAGLWSLSGRIEGLEDAPAGLRERAAKARSGVEALAQSHVEGMGVPEKVVFDGKAWVGHLPVFLRAFAGVPAREDLARRLKDTLATHQKDAVAHLRKYWPALQKGKTAEAFEEGVAALASGFLWHECADADLLKNLKEWHKSAKKLKLPKAAVKAYDAVFEDFEKAIVEGRKAYDSLQRGYRGG